MSAGYKPMSAGYKPMSAGYKPMSAGMPMSIDAPVPTDTREDRR